MVHPLIVAVPEQSGAAFFYPLTQSEELFSLSFKNNSIYHKNHYEKRLMNNNVEVSTERIGSTLKKLNKFKKRSFCKKPSL